MEDKRVKYPNLLAELARQDMSVTALAERIGTARQNLYNKLNGKTVITLDDCFNIQSVLKANSSDGGDYTLDYLFTRVHG